MGSCKARDAKGPYLYHVTQGWGKGESARCVTFYYVRRGGRGGKRDIVLRNTPKKIFVRCPKITYFAKQLTIGTT